MYIIDKILKFELVATGARRSPVHNIYKRLKLGGDKYRTLTLVLHCPTNAHKLL